jgi:hypothetical protein
LSAAPTKTEDQAIANPTTEPIAVAPQSAIESVNEKELEVKKPAPADDAEVGNFLVGI